MTKPASHRRRNPRAFVLEDDPLVLEVTTMVIQEHGFEVVEAQSLKAAYQAFDNDPTFDLVVIDLDLEGGMKGMWIGEYLKGLVPDHCIKVYYTGHDTRRGDRDPKVWRYILKNQEERFRKAIEDAMDKYHLQAVESPEINEEFQDEVLNRSTDISINHQYVLGCFEVQRSIYSQQVRALRLVRAMAEIEDLVDGSSVAVIGGGIAGATAAVAAALKGASVTVFDPNSEIMEYQSSSSVRYIHPHIYRWPDKGSECPDAELPFLSWSAGIAKPVTEDLRQKFADWCRRLDQLKFEPAVVDRVEKREDTSDFRVYVEGNRCTSHDLVIHAPGYGLEKYSYWSGDNIDGPFSRDPWDILVAGVGDGGLIDFARAAMSSSAGRSHCEHGELVEWVLQDPDCRKLAKKMKDVDRKTRRVHKNTKELSRLYDELDFPDTLCEKFNGLKRSKTRAFLLHRRSGIFRSDTALINRLVALLIIRSKIGYPIYGDFMSTRTVGGSGEDQVSKIEVFYKVGEESRVKICDQFVDRRGDTIRPPAENLLLSPKERELMRKACLQDENPVCLDDETFRYWNHEVHRAPK